MQTVSTEIAISCIITLDAMFIFLLIEYVTVTQVYTIPAMTIKLHKNLVDVHALIIKHVPAMTSDKIANIFIAICPFFTLIILGYKVMHTIPFY